jgi:hypothetical protein
MKIFVRLEAGRHRRDYNGLITRSLEAEISDEILSKPVTAHAEKVLHRTTVPRKRRWNSRATYADKGGVTTQRKLETAASEVTGL